VTTEEARNTGVGITKTERGKYGNPQIIYDMNDGLIDSILDVVPTAEQRAEREKKAGRQTEQPHDDEGERI
jgi:hypothetical protein